MMQNSLIEKIETKLFAVPLPEVLSDAKHGDHSHFELVTVTVTLKSGKTVTAVTFREGDPSDPAGLARSLRTDLGCGGVYEEKEDRILLQGDQVERAADWFTRRGTKVTRGTGGRG